MPGFDYIGRYAYHLIVVTANRQLELVSDTADHVVSSLRSAAVATHFELLAFAVMPDHVHILALGIHDDANLIRCMQRFKQLTGFHFKREHGRELWQWSYFDRVVRRDEDLATVARYVLGNPTEAGLVVAGEAWPHPGGSMSAEVDPCPKNGAEAPKNGAEAPSLQLHGRGREVHTQ
jgi:REP element-mobilizing transposase RayT